MACMIYTSFLPKLHSKTHVHLVAVLWLDNDDVVTILSPTSGTSGNHVSLPPWFLHGDDCVWWVPSVFPCSDHAVAY